MNNDKTIDTITQVNFYFSFNFRRFLQNCRGVFGWVAVWCLCLPPPSCCISIAIYQANNGKNFIVFTPSKTIFADTKNTATANRLRCRTSPPAGLPKRQGTPK